jgi:predicted nucleic acid-binding protein
VTAQLLLDASVWLAAVDQDDRYHDSALGLLEASAAGRLITAAIDLTLYEVSNVAVVRWRSPSAATRLVALVLAACPDTLLRADSELLREAVAATDTNDLTVYDGAYVAAAARHGWTLVSADLRDLVGPGLAVAPDDPVLRPSG